MFLIIYSSYQKVKSQLCWNGELLLIVTKIAVPLKLRQVKQQTVHLAHIGMNKIKEAMQLKVWWHRMKLMNTNVRWSQNYKLQNQSLGRTPLPRYYLLLLFTILLFGNRLPKCQCAFLIPIFLPQ